MIDWLRRELNDVFGLFAAFTFVVAVALGRALVINADEPASWTATIEDPSIVSFTAGTADGAAEFNPGFEPLAVGATTVTMTDGTSTVNFTVEVTA